MRKAPGSQSPGLSSVGMRLGATYGSGTPEAVKIKSHLLKHVDHYAMVAGPVTRPDHHVRVTRSA